MARLVDPRPKVGELVRLAHKRMSAADYRSGLTKKKKTAEPRGWRAAWRTIGGQRVYFRSRWEANYAAVLEFRRTTAKSITKWEHEPETFWFEGIKRGVCSYLPDFKVTLPDGSVEWHEVKGRFDARSKTKVRRMAKYHPTVKLIVIDAAAYKSIARTFRSLPWWEK